jgi:hypothetical protein
MTGSWSIQFCTLCRKSFLLLPPLDILELLMYYCICTHSIHCDLNPLDVMEVLICRTSWMFIAIHITTTYLLMVSTNEERLYITKADLLCISSQFTPYRSLVWSHCRLRAVHVWIEDLVKYIELCMHGCPARDATWLISMKSNIELLFFFRYVTCQAVEGLKRSALCATCAEFQDLA